MLKISFNYITSIILNKNPYTISYDEIYSCNRKWNNERHGCC